MSSLLDVVNANPDKYTIEELPTKSGEVSIMTLEQVYEALEDTIEDGHKWDPTYGYNTSTYYMYAINDASLCNDALTHSTRANLEEIGTNWYKNLDQHKPISIDHRWAKGIHILFGGPLYDVFRYTYARYGFGWYTSENTQDITSSEYCWNDCVSGSVYVAIVHR